MHSCVQEDAQDQWVEGVAQLEHCETVLLGIVACLGARQQAVLYGDPILSFFRCLTKIRKWPLIEMCIT